MIQYCVVTRSCVLTRRGERLRQLGWGAALEHSPPRRMSGRGQTRRRRRWCTCACRAGLCPRTSGSAWWPEKQGQSIPLVVRSFQTQICSCNVESRKLDPVLAGFDTRIFKPRERNNCAKLRGPIMSGMYISTKCIAQAAGRTYSTQFSLYSASDTRRRKRIHKHQNSSRSSNHNNLNWNNT